ncbi:unknown [Prevotella sp. CAG:592]|nr:unknown [Prevotella sp. CAG:592]
MIYAIIIAFYINFPTKRDKYKTPQSKFSYFLLVSH